VLNLRFNQYGDWYDVLIDDYLPVFASGNRVGNLVFCTNNNQKNEFWPALLVKISLFIYPIIKKIKSKKLGKSICQVINQYYIYFYIEK
jgi:hypothetical protein